jgi:hypothetical protein
VDPAPGSGVKEVRFFYRYCPLAVGCGPEIAIGIDNTPPSPFSVVWSDQPSCGTAPEDRFRLIARPIDNCGNVGADALADVRSVGRGCLRAGSGTIEVQGGSWQSVLQPAGARGQVVVDGAQAVFPAAGRESFATPLAPGAHRFEATLVEAAARPGGGSWGFELQGLRVSPGSLRVVAGDVAQVGADTIVFRLRGRAGERVVFAFEVAGE